MHHCAAACYNLLMKLSQIGEFGLIEILKLAEKSKLRKDTLVGIGDDCAVIEGLGTGGRGMGKYQLITTDTFIENVHFKLQEKNGRNRAMPAGRQDFSRRRDPFFAIGQKVMIANISDIAAMGGWPTHALVTIGLPKHIRVEQVQQLYKGINQMAAKHQIDIIGGDTISSPREVVISITLLGEVERENLLLRSGANRGDVICVTGKFGGPAANKFQNPKTCLPAGRSKIQTRIKESGIISKSKLVHAMIDSSDGLVRSVIEICRASKTGAQIWEERVPIDKGATIDQALYGGEEYELVFTLPKQNVAKLKALKLKVTIVGEIVTQGSGIKLIDKHGKIKKLKSGGYEHFR